MNAINTILNTGMILDDRYVILEFIGRGGMGEVYRAHQLNLNRDVAIKIISQEWLESLEDDEEEIECALDRFQREVEVMAQVRHPNVVQVPPQFKRMGKSLLLSISRWSTSLGQRYASPCQRKDSLLKRMISRPG